MSISVESTQSSGTTTAFADLDHLFLSESIAGGGMAPPVTVSSSAALCDSLNSSLLFSSSSSASSPSFHSSSPHSVANSSNDTNLGDMSPFNTFSFDKLHSSGGFDELDFYTDSLNQFTSFCSSGYNSFTSLAHQTTSYNYNGLLKLSTDEDDDADYPFKDIEEEFEAASVAMSDDDLTSNVILDYNGSRKTRVARKHKSSTSSTSSLTNIKKVAIELQQSAASLVSSSGKPSHASSLRNFYHHHTADVDAGSYFDNNFDGLPNIEEWEQMFDEDCIYRLTAGDNAPAAPPPVDKHQSLSKTSNTVITTVRSAVPKNEPKVVDTKQTSGEKVLRQQAAVKKPPSIEAHYNSSGKGTASLTSVKSGIVKRVTLANSDAKPNQVNDQSVNVNIKQEPQLPKPHSSLTVLQTKKTRGGNSTSTAEATRANTDSSVLQPLSVQTTQHAQNHATSPGPLSSCSTDFCEIIDCINPDQIFPYRFQVLQQYMKSDDKSLSDTQRHGMSIEDDDDDDEEIDVVSVNGSSSYMYSTPLSSQASNGRNTTMKPKAAPKKSTTAQSKQQQQRNGQVTHLKNGSQNGHSSSSMLSKCLKTVKATTNQANPPTVTKTTVVKAHANHDYAANASSNVTSTAMTNARKYTSLTMPTTVAPALTTATAPASGQHFIKTTKLNNNPSTPTTTTIINKLQVVPSPSLTLSAPEASSGCLQLPFSRSGAAASLSAVKQVTPTSSASMSVIASNANHNKTTTQGLVMTSVDRKTPPCSSLLKQNGTSVSTFNGTGTSNSFSPSIRIVSARPSMTEKSSNLPIISSTSISKPASSLSSVQTLRPSIRLLNSKDIAVNGSPVQQTTEFSSPSTSSLTNVVSHIRNHVPLTLNAVNNMSASKPNHHQGYASPLLNKPSFNINLSTPTSPNVKWNSNTSPSKAKKMAKVAGGAHAVSQLDMFSLHHNDDMMGESDELMQHFVKKEPRTPVKQAKVKKSSDEATPLFDDHFGGNYLDDLDMDDMYDDLDDDMDDDMDDCSSDASDSSLTSSSGYSTPMHTDVQIKLEPDDVATKCDSVSGKKERKRRKSKFLLLNARSLSPLSQQYLSALSPMTTAGYSSKASRHAMGYTSENPAEKRAFHILSERQRRNDLKKLFEILRINIPNLCDKQKASKLTILKASVDHLNEVTNKGEKLQAEQSREIQRNAQLIQHLKSLQQQSSQPTSPHQQQKACNVNNSNNSNANNAGHYPGGQKTQASLAVQG